MPGGATPRDDAGLLKRPLPPPSTHIPLPQGCGDSPARIAWSACALESEHTLRGAPRFVLESPRLELGEHVFRRPIGRRRIERLGDGSHCP